MTEFRRIWMISLLSLAACGRSPLSDPKGDASALVRPDPGLPPCEGGLTQCGKRNVSLCYDLSRSRENCGACGHTCAPGIACQAGACQQVRCQGPLSFKALEVVEAWSGELEHPYRPTLGDFDGDGILDIAGIAEITDAGGILAGAKLLTGTNLLYGAGDGTFPTVARIETSRIQNWRNFSSDLDGDGHLDLVSIRESLAAVGVRRGSGKRGTPFAEATTYPTSQAPDSLLVADLDSDGHPDLVAGVASNLESWRGQGDGRFEHRATLPIRGSASILQAADWNHDGALDLVFGSSNLNLRYGRGDGTFDPEVICGLALTGPSFAPSPYNPMIAPLNLAADLDHDQVIDLVGPTSIFLGLDGCAPSRIVPMADRRDFFDSSLRVAELADLNGDGNLDIVVLPGLYLGDGKGGFAEHIELSILGTPSAMILVGDLNRDRKLDLIAVGAQGWQVLLNTCP